MNRRTMRVLVAAVFLVATVFLVRSYLWSPNSGPVFQYDTAAVSVGEVRMVVATSGTVKPRDTVQIGSELSGRIKSIVSDFNSPVKAGDVLAIIDPKTFEAKVKQARADLQSAEALLISSEATVRKASANLENAVAVHDRHQLLGQKGISAQTNIDEAVRGLNVARAEVEVAKANHENARAGVAQKAAQLEQATIDLERTNVRTPISGIVLNRSVDVGQTVAASLQAPELFRVAGDLSSIHIEAQVSEVDVGRINRGQPAEFQVDAYPGRTFHGNVEQVRLAPTAADAVVTYAVIITAENKRFELFPGMTAHVKIETSIRKDVPRVTLDAIRFKPPKGGHASAEKGTSLWSRLSSMVASHASLPAARANEEDEEPSTKSSAKSDPKAVIRRWARRLQMDAQQVGDVEALVAAGLGAAEGKKGRSAPNDEKRAGERASTSAKRQVEEYIAQVLRPEQMEAFEAQRGQRRSAQSVQVWVLSATGVPERRAVRIGLTGTHFAELTGSELKVGDAVVVRSRKVTVR